MPPRNIRLPPEAKNTFRYHEQLALTRLLLVELQRMRAVWSVLRFFAKARYYLLHPASIWIKLNYYAHKITGRDALDFQIPDTFEDAYWRKSLEYLRWTLAENNPPHAVRQIEALLNARPYRGVMVYPTTIPYEPLQRPQQLLRQMAKLGYLCFYCEDYSPKFSLAKIDENLYAVSGEQYLIFPLQSRPVTVLCTWMMNLPFVNQIRDVTLWYDLIDRLEIFSLYDSHMLQKHQQVVEAADIVSYSAKSLKDLVQPRADALYLPNGVNVEDFSTPLSAPPDERILAALRSFKSQKQAVIGFYGAIAEWVDLSLIRSAAQARPGWQFVLIGRPWREVREVEDLPNVLLTGQVPYSSLPLYASQFDVAIIPFRLEPLTDSVSPIKFFEYAALGLPVVMTPFEEVRQYAQLPFVRLAAGTDEFIAAIEELCARRDEDMARSARQFALENHWQARARQIDTLLCPGSRHDRV